jgi:hypothetical protein
MEELKKKRRRNSFDRIVLSEETQTILAGLISEIAEATNGMVKLHGRELANFLIQTRCQSLSTDEVAQLRAKYFDEAKAANWMVSQIRSAKTRGEKVDLEELIKIIQMQSVDKKPRVNRSSKKSKMFSPDASSAGNNEVISSLGDAQNEA